MTSSMSQTAKIRPSKRWAALGFFEQVFSASSNHHAAVVDPTFDHRLQSQGAGALGPKKFEYRKSFAVGCTGTAAFHHMDPSRV